MNNISKIFVLGLTTLVLSCNPNMVDEPPTSPTELDYFSSADEFRQMTIGAYAGLINFYHYNGPWAHSTWLLPGDDLTESNGRRTSVELFDNSLNPNNAQMSYIFEQSYKIVQRANVVLHKTETIEYQDFEGAAEISMMRGEAFFLRGYAYFTLYNIYGGVPIILKRIEEREEANTPVSAASDVLDQAIDDFRAAIDLLPASWDPQWAGRATKNSSRGMLLKSLVFRANYSGNTADYTEALQLFPTLTSTLTTDYIDNFNSHTENNAESLFEVQSAAPATNNSNQNLINDGGWRGVENMSVYRGNMMQPGDPGDFNHYSNTRFLITDKLLNNFGDDPRLTVFLNADDGLNGRIFQKYNLPAGVHEINMYHGGSLNNERVLRHADVLLLAAEANLKTGDPGTAIAQVNEVRARAREWAANAGLGDGTQPANHPTGETNENVIMQWVMDERFVELAGEGHRFWDLKRWHAAGDIDLTGWGGGDEHFSTELASPVEFDVNKHLLFPLPQVEVERNTAITGNNPNY